MNSTPPAGQLVSGNSVSVGVGSQRIVGADVDVLRNAAAKIARCSLYCIECRMRAMVMCRGAGTGVCKFFLLQAGCSNCLRLYSIELGKG